MRPLALRLPPALEALPPAARKRILLLATSLLASGAFGAWSWWSERAAAEAERVEAEQAAAAAAARRAKRNASAAAPAPNATAPASAATPVAAPVAKAAEASPAPTVAPTVAPTAAPVAKAEPAAKTDSVRVVRELFGYAPAGRRDPYRALIATDAIRPLPNEVRLSAVAFDPSGVQSVAILRDLTTKQQYRVRAGQLLGRMRILRIRQKAIVYAIEELGYSRTAELSLTDTTATRPQP